VQVGVPRTEVGRLRDQLWEPHRQHLVESIAYGPPTHLRDHHSQLVRTCLRRPIGWPDRTFAQA